MKTKLLVLALLLLLLSTPLAQVVYAEDNTGENGNGNIDPLVYQQIKEDAESRWWTLYYLYTSQQVSETAEGDGGDDITGEYDGPEIPEELDHDLRKQLMNAWMQLRQASEMEVENLQSAAQQYLQVMKILRNTLRKYQKDNPEIVDETIEPPDPVEEQFDLPSEPTEADLTLIQEQLINRFHERFKESVTSMFQFYNEIEDDLDPDDAIKAYNTLRNTELKLLRIQERINIGDNEDVIDELEEISNDLVKGYNEMTDPHSSQLFKTATKLQAKIEKMIEMKEQKDALGEDISSYDNMINQLIGNIDKAKNEYKENKGKSNGKGKN